MRNLLTLAVSLALVGCQPSYAAVSATAPVAVCHTIPELASRYAPEDKMVSYTFRDLDAHKIIGALIHQYGTPPGNLAVTVVLAYATVAGTFDLYLYDEAGCYTVNAPETYDLPMMQQLFDFLGIALPIGSTFYQLPGIKA